MIQVLVAVLLAGFIAGCGGGGDGGSGGAVLATAGQAAATSAADASIGKFAASARKPDEDPSLCTVEIYGDSIMAFLAVPRSRRS
jgi:hypothetical protein